MKKHQRYREAISDATETRDIEFKGSLTWSKIDQCGRFEILKDMAALANIGGGLLIVGPDEPDFKKGSLTDAQLRSFDPTDVNQLANQYLGPPHNRNVVRLTVGKRRIVVIDVPGFQDGPLIFQKVGNCGKCRSPHFNRADVFVRSRSNQTVKISEPYEMRDLIETAMQQRMSTSDALLRTALHDAVSRLEVLSSPDLFDTVEYAKETDMLGTFREAPRDAAIALDTASSRAAQDISDYAGGAFYPWTTLTGHYRLVVYPEKFRAARFDRKMLASVLRKLRVTMISGSEEAHIPFVTQSEAMNYPGFAENGDRQPPIARYELYRFHESGLFTMVRIFPEDYVDGTLVMDQRRLDFRSFVATVTGMFRLAAGIAMTIGTGENYFAELKIDGLQNRSLVSVPNVKGNPPRSHPCTVSEMLFPNILSATSLSRRWKSIAADSISETLWNFGLDSSQLVAKEQRRTRFDFNP